MNNAAILIIDMQKDFFKLEVLQEKSQALVSNINELTNFARINGIPVIWIR